MDGTNGHAPVTQASQGSHLGSSELLENPEALQKRLQQEFKTFAKVAGPSGELVLDYEALANLTNWLAMELGVDSSIFGEMSQMFWRFDYTGDLLLREPEATQLMMCMMRNYRDATRPPQAGCIRLGGNIQYKCAHDEFTFGEKIGEGGQGSVFLCTGRGSFTSWLTDGSKQVVLKMFDKSNPSAPIEDITREFELLTELRHPLIAHVFEIFQDASNIYIVQEPYLGGDLSTAVHRASENGVRVTERWLAQIVQQVLTGVAFLHKSTVMHCDLKEPNVMIPRNTDWSAPHIVVIDFGLANKFATRSRPGGTPGYMPPEVWSSGLWTPRGDVFSIGVLLFSMRTGRQPFSEGCRSIEDVKAKTQHFLPFMEEGSQELRNLIGAMTAKNFQNRPMIAAALQDPWFSTTDEDCSEPLDEKVLDSLRKRKSKTDLKKALLTDLASRENLAQMKELNELFLQLDVNGDGVVSADEVYQALTGRWSQTRIDELVQALLGGNEGEVSYEEFMGQLIAAKEPVENELLWRLFSEMDKNKKGYLDKDDIIALLERPAVAKVLGGREPQGLLKQMSRDGTGRVTFDDFKLALQGYSESPVEASLGKLRRQFRFGIMTQWQDDQAAEYYSVVHDKWLPCIVTAVDNGSGAVQVDIKPGGYWLHGIELWTRLRRPMMNSWLSWLPPCLGARACGV